MPNAKPCGKLYYSMQDIVAHITVDHIGGPEQTDHACYWENCARDGKPFKAKYKVRIFWEAVVKPLKYSPLVLNVLHRFKTSVVYELFCVFTLL